MKTSRIPYRLLVVALVLSAAMLPVEAEVRERFHVDLTRDGRAEVVELDHYQAPAYGSPRVDFAQLNVRQSNGRLLWAGPRPGRIEGSGPVSDLVFGAHGFDEGTIQVVGDIGRDGTVELIGDYPVSDVRPTRFRLLAWTGRKFQPLHSGDLREPRPGSGVFRWTRLGNTPGKADAYLRARFITRFKQVSQDGSCLVTVTSFRGGDGIPTPRKDYRAVAVPGGFQLR